jgi:hypothetical protein
MALFLIIRIDDFGYKCLLNEYHNSYTLRRFLLKKNRQINIFLAFEQDTNQSRSRTRSK